MCVFKETSTWNDFAEKYKVDMISSYLFFKEDERCKGGINCICYENLNFKKYIMSSSVLNEKKIISFLGNTFLWHFNFYDISDLG